MSNSVTLPYIYFPDPSQGRPVFNGSIYVGEPDTDPKVPVNQKSISVRQEDGTLVPVAQPVDTGSGGVPLYNGSPVSIVVDDGGPYSLRVDNNQGSQVYYVSESGGASDLLNTDKRYGPIFATVAAMTAANPVSVDGVEVDIQPGITVDTQGYATAGGGGGARYLIQTAAEFGGTPDEVGASFTLANGNVAVLQVTGSIHVAQFGVFSSSTAAVNTTGINAAISAAIADITNSSVVQLGYGTYSFNNTLVGADNVTLQGHGQNATILQLAANSTPTGFAEKNLIIAEDKDFFKVRHFTLDGNKANQTDTDHYGLTNRTRSGTSQGFDAYDVEVKNVSGFHGIWVYGATNFRIDSCYTHGNNVNGDGIVCQAFCKDGIITNNISTDNDIGIEIEGREGDLSNPANIKPCERIIVANNICTANQDIGILCLTNYDCDIHGNTVYLNSNDGIKISGGEDIDIENNRIFGSGRHGIFASNESYGNNLKIIGLTIENNEVYENTQIGVVVDRTSAGDKFENVSVSENKAHSNTGRGIFVANLNGFSLDRNFAYGNGNSNIEAWAMEDGSIDSNHAYNAAATYDGVRVAVDATNVSVSRNKCFDNQSVATQAIGINVTATGGSNNTVKDNEFWGNVTAEYNSATTAFRFEGDLASDPSGGTESFDRGSMWRDPLPTASGFIGKVCVTAGAPGTWKTWGAISA